MALCLVRGMPRLITSTIYSPFLLLPFSDFTHRFGRRPVLKNGNFLKTHKDATVPESGKYTISELDPGYYLVVDKADATLTDPDAYSDYIVEVLGTATDITPKSDIPTVDKTVSDDVSHDATDANAATNINQGSGWYESADHAINKNFQFKLVATIPASVDLNDYTNGYELTFEDTMSAGITFVKIDSVKIKDADDAEYTAIPSNKYTPSSNIYAEGAYKELKGDGTTKWTLKIDNVKDTVADLDYSKEIKIDVVFIQVA